MVSSDKYFEGIVEKWCARDGNYGFISYRRDGQECRTFFPNASIRPDEIGKTSQCWVEGVLVRFKIEQVVHKGESRTIAVDVHPVFADEPIKCPEAHREVSQVVRFLQSRNGAWIKREDGSQLFLRIKNVLPEYVDRFREIHVGDFVFHAVAENLDREDGAWEATHVEIFSREENERLLRGDEEPEQIAETVSQPQSAAEPESVLAPCTKNLSLLEIIRRRKNHG